MTDEDQDQALRGLFKGASIVYVGLVAEILIAFLAQLIAARTLSLSGFGSITTGTALLNIGAIVGGLGLGEGLTRYLPRISEQREKQGFTYATLVAVCGFSVLLAVPVVYWAETIAADVFGDPSVAVAIRVFGAVIPFAVLLEFAIGGIRGQKVSKYRVYVKNLLQPTTRFGLVIVVTLLGLDQFGFAVAYAIPYVVAAVVALALLSRTLPVAMAWSTIDRSRLREFVRYSLPFTVTGLTGFVYRSVDVFLVLYFLGSAEVGIYGVAYAAARLILMFSTAVSFLGVPVASELEQTLPFEDIASVYNTVLRWLVLASIPALMPLVLFPAEFISVVYRPRYAPGALALAVLAVGFWVHNVFTINGNLMRGLGRSRLLAVNTTIAAVLNTTANLYLIPRYGILGAAVATVGAYLTMDLLMFTEVRLITGNTPLGTNLLAVTLLALPLYLVTWYLSPRVPSTLPWLVFVTAVFGIVYWALALVTLGLSEADVMMVESMRERYGVDHWTLDLLLRWFA